MPMEILVTYIPMPVEKCYNQGMINVAVMPATIKGEIRYE